jgi:nitrile hydratase subunit beta
MTRIRNIGGAQGFGAIEPAPDEPRFKHDWEARMLALALVLVRNGVLGRDEVEAGVARAALHAAHSTSPYEHLLDALCALLVEHEILTEPDLAAIDGR